MAVLFERPGFWRCELTDRGVFFVRIQTAVVDAATLDAFMDSARPHLERLAPVRYMNDASDVQDAKLTLQWRLAQYMKENARFIAKSGVFGLTPAKAFVVRSVARAAGRTNLRVFDSRAACEEWLLS
jgi:hypothetical protein